MKKGISLIILIITIIVIIILAGTVLLGLISNNPVNEATEAKFKMNVKSYQSELTLWLSKMFVKNSGTFLIQTVNANQNTGEYEGLRIQDIINTMSNKKGGYTEDATKFAIKAGELIFSGEDSVEQQWAIEAGIKLDNVVVADTVLPLMAQITGDKEAKKNAILKNTISVSDNIGGSGINLAKSKYIISEQVNAYGINNAIWNSATILSMQIQEIIIPTNKCLILYVHVLTEDNAENKIETVSDKIQILNDPYITSGLMLHFDGRDAPKLINEKYYWVSRVGDYKAEMMGFSNANGGATGSGYDALTHEYKFDGIDDTMGIGEVNPTNYTIELFVEPSMISTTEKMLLGNCETGGYYIRIFNGIAGHVYYSTALNTYQVISDNTVIKENYQTITGTLDSKVVKLYIDATLRNSLALKGTLKPPDNNTWLYLACNPAANLPTNVSGYAKMKIKSLRIYNRVLTDAELKQNNEADRSSFL